MRPFRERLKPAGLIVALYAMIFQALIPFAQGIPVERDNGGFDSLVICTAWGVKVLQLTTGKESPVKPTAPQNCPVCSVHSLKLSLPGVDIPAPEPAFLVGLPLRPEVGYLPPEQAPLTHSLIRAPPQV